MHRWSTLFIPTLREAPADAEVASHKLLLRAGYVRQLGAGIYSYPFLGQRSINKIVAIIRQEMDTIAQEFLLPTLHPRELWEESGRWTGMGQNMFRLTDRKGAELALGMTHEEVMTSIARNELRSYKQLPQIWYQIQTKFRDEPRPKSGLLRVRQFLMKDSYSFDLDEAGLDKSYDLHDKVYRQIFTRCGLEFVAVEADSGAMGGSQSQEFMVYTEAGEDLIASSPSGYAANLEKATSKLAPVEDLAPTGDGLPELVHTPGKASIADVTAFFGIQASQDIKCVAFMGLPTAVTSEVPARPVVAFLRGDHQVNETKLATISGVAELRPMDPEELALHIGGPAGFLGPIGIPQVMTQGSLNGLNSGKSLDKLKGVSRDNAAEGLRTIVVHGLRPRRPLQPCSRSQPARHALPQRNPLARLHPHPHRRHPQHQRGRARPHPRRAPAPRQSRRNRPHLQARLQVLQSPWAPPSSTRRQRSHPHHGSYGIGVERILTAAIETSAAANGGEAYALPAAIAPFQVIVTITNVKEQPLVEAAQAIAQALDKAGFDVLLDDRDERAGVKFKDADLTGVPYRIAVGKKLTEGKVEFLDRLTNQTHDIPVDAAVQHLQTLLS